MGLHLWAIKDIWSVLVEDDGLPVQVTRAGHRQEGKEEDHDGQGAPGLARQLCRIRTGAGAWDWLLRLAAWCAAPTKAAWAVLGGRLCGGGNTFAYLPLLYPLSMTLPSHIFTMRSVVV